MNPAKRKKLLRLELQKKSQSDKVQTVSEKKLEPVVSIPTVKEQVIEKEQEKVVQKEEVKEETKVIQETSTVLDSPLELGLRLPEQQEGKKEKKKKSSSQE